MGDKLLLKTKTKGEVLLGPVSRKAQKLFGPEGKFSNPNLLNCCTAHKPVNFESLADRFIFSIFKIIETLTLNVNAANTKQLSGPEKLPGLSRHRPLGPLLRKQTLQAKEVYCQVNPPYVSVPRWRVLKLL